MHYERLKSLIILTVLAIVFSFAVSCATANQSDEDIELLYMQELPEEIEFFFFHDTACADCDGTEDFRRLFDEKIGEKRDMHPYRIRAFNVFGITGHEALENLTSSLGLSDGDYFFPLLIVNSRAYSGLDSIGNNLLEAFLTAGNDIFINRSVYIPNPARTDPFEGLSVNPARNTLVYFYRIICPGCIDIEPMLNALPEFVYVDGERIYIELIRLNTRSGNNGTRVRAFFSEWNVPDEHQMVPIVFLSDTYFAGYEAIKDNLIEALGQGAGLNFRFPGH